MMKLRTGLALLLPVLALCGCANYRWTSRVPDEIRTVAVPVFENRTALSPSTAPTARVRTSTATS